MLRIVLSILFLVSVACSDGSAHDDTAAAAANPAAPLAEPAPSTTPVESTEAAPVFALVGIVKYEGPVRESEEVDLTPDPFCHEHGGERARNTPSLREGPVRDVFIQLTGVPDRKYETPETPVVLDQRGCTYVPHVFGVQKKQDIEIRNSDATLHNIHPTPAINKEFNLAMPNRGDVREKSFRRVEDRIPVKCDVHPWMRAYCFVLDHPYFAVSRDDGTFELDLTGLPDGTYGLKGWHELAGDIEGTVIVAGGKAENIELSYKGE